MLTRSKHAFSGDLSDTDLRVFMSGKWCASMSVEQRVQNADLIKAHNKSLWNPIISSPIMQS